MAPSGSSPDSADADDVRDQHRDGLAEHRRLGLDAAHAPAQHADAVDHRGVRVGAHQRVGVGAAHARRSPAPFVSGETKTTRARYSRFTWWTMPVFGGTTPTLAKACCAQRRSA